MFFRLAYILAKKCKKHKENTGVVVDKIKL